MMLSIESGQARIIEGETGVTLDESSVMVFAQTAAGPTNSPEVAYVIVNEPCALDGAAYPSLVAMWDNEQDAIFDTI